MISIILSGCWAVDKSVQYGKKKVVEIGENVSKKGLENVAPGSTDLIPLLDHEGNAVFNEDGQQAFVTRTSMVDDIVALFNGGAGIGSILMYLMYALIWFFSDKLGGKRTQKRMGSLVDIKTAALDLVTSRINKAMGNGGGTVIKNLVDNIALGANRHTAVGAVIHDSVKKTDHHRNTGNGNVATI